MGWAEYTSESNVVVALEAASKVPPVMGIYVPVVWEKV
jgi:hypothetical protein